MLTGTLVTVAGFIPIGFNGSAAGEYTYSLFVVIAAALLVRWVVAVLFAPLIGVKILPQDDEAPRSREARSRPPVFRPCSDAMRLRWVTILGCLGLSALSIGGLGHVQQQFFPSADGRNSSST